MPDGPLPLDDLAVRAIVDVAAVGVLLYGVALRRHARPDLAVLAALVNVGLFVAVVVISTAEIGVGVGFGLFAVLSIVRLRSDTFTNTELGYVFAAIVVGLACGVDLGDVRLSAALAAIVVLAAAIVDTARLNPRTTRSDVTLEHASADPDALRPELEERLGVRVLHLRVLEVDYVRETTRVAVHGVARVEGATPAAARPRPEVVGADPR